MGNYYAGMINNTGGYGELKHHGILGQKWGVRRWQNADGSLTAAGRERYNKGTEKYLGKKDANAYRNADADTRAAVDKIVKKIKRDELIDAAKTAGVSALLGIGGGMGYNNATFGKREERIANDNKRIKELLYGKDKSSMDIPKIGSPAAQSKSITKWFGSNRLSDLKNDMRKNGASNFDEYLQSISDNPDAVRADLDKRANEVKDRISKSYYKLAKAAEETPERYISTESLEGRLASKSDDYKYVRDVVSNAYDITDYRKIYSEYESARARRANSAFGGFENSKHTKNLRAADNKLKRASKDLEGLSLSAAFDYIEKLPKSDQDAYKAYLYCLMGYDW